MSIRDEIESNQEVIKEKIEELGVELGKDPENLELLRRRGSLYIQANKLDLASKDILKCVEMNPQDAESYFLLYEIAIFKNDYSQALKFVNKAIKINPEKPKYYHFKGFIHHQREEYELALINYEHALSLDPIIGAPRTYFKRGDTYRAMNEIDNAIEEYEKAIDSVNQLYEIGQVTPEEQPYPYLYQFYLHLGHAYKSKSDYKAALKCYNQVIELIPDNNLGYYHRGMLRKDLNKIDEALVDFNLIIDRDPENYEYYYLRGECHLIQQNYEAAIKDSSDAISLGISEPSRFLFHFSRGNAYFFSGKYDKAILDFTTTIELNPEDTQALLNRGNCYMAIKNLDNALADYNKALKFRSDYISALRNRSLIYIEKNKLELAVADLEKVDSLMTQKDPSVHFNLAIGHLKLNNLSKALGYMEPLLNQYPDDPRILYNYARILGSQNQIKKATKILQQAITLQSDFYQYAQADPVLSKVLKNL
ncbi:MAG: tetratricopeptide repeat protein [Candidatus Hodarchaeota archaeon]